MRNQSLLFMATSKNVIPAKAGIQKLLTSLDTRLSGSDKFIIIRGSLMNRSIFRKMRICSRRITKWKR